MNILVTGASGFVGLPLIHHLFQKGFNVTAFIRTPLPLDLPIKFIINHSIYHAFPTAESLASFDVIIHLIARVHVSNSVSCDEYSLFKSVNVDMTMYLARLAKFAGVKRFIYISSIKVNGEFTTSNTCFTNHCLAKPSNPYALTKYVAEQELLALSTASDFEVVILRPPLIYGPNSKGNLHQLMKLLKGSMPLPLGSIDYNRRSMICIQNLLDVIVICLSHPLASNRVFLLSDDDDVSTKGLIIKICNYLGRQPLLFNTSPKLLSSVSYLCGKKDLYTKLCLSLRVDLSNTSSTLSWKPKFSLDEGLKNIFH
ncbi:NAD dependent epimerase/dehydratase family protein [Synechococcus sp. A18-40]|nr:NAD dependent epimerase/dehydratase family protein [Synechococcus sp. A18-40]